MTESHPFAPFVPPNASILILGSFPGIHQTRKLNETEEWFYSAKRNQFWKILEAVYSGKFETVDDKKMLFLSKGIAITDIILEAKRKQESNLDQHLYDIVYNTAAIQAIFDTMKIEKVWFTSKFVEKHFKIMFPQYINGNCLPSPSPRYARMTLKDKISFYRNNLPQ